MQLYSVKNIVFNKISAKHCVKILFLYHVILL